MGGRGRKRRFGFTFEERVWRWARRQDEPICRRSVMTHFQVSGNAASHCLCRLWRRGSLKREGATSSSRYTPTTVAPCDLRGTSVKTMANLRKYSIVQRWSAQP